MKLKTILLGLVATLAAPCVLHAEEQAHGGYETLGEARDWTAIRFKSGPTEGSMSCAIFSRPKASRVIEGSQEVDALRGEKAAFITWHNGTEVKEDNAVLSLLVGALVVSQDAGHDLRIDNKTSYALYGFEDRTYTKQEDDLAVLKAAKNGYRMVARSKLSETRIAEDEYSLRGVQAATAIAARACN